MGDQYPKWVMHPDGRSIIAKDYDDHQRYAAQGYLTAAEYDAASGAPGSSKNAEAAGGKESFETLSAATAIERVESELDTDVLRAWRSAEENRTGGPRKTVLRALADKLGESAAGEPASDQGNTE